MDKPLLITATRYHDFSYGHRVTNHESKCAFLHGHNGRVHFTISAELDAVGRVLDFSAIKEYLCEWLEENWDHKFLAWGNGNDPVMSAIGRFIEDGTHSDETEQPATTWLSSIVWVPFNPTAENMALHLLNVVGPSVLPTGCRLIHVKVEETRKCSAEASAA